MENGFFSFSPDEIDAQKRRRQALQNVPIIPEFSAFKADAINQDVEQIKYEYLLFGTERLLNPTEVAGDQWEEQLTKSRLVCKTHLYNIDGEKLTRNVKVAYEPYEKEVYMSQRFIGWSHELRLNIYHNSTAPLAGLPFNYTFLNYKRVSRNLLKEPILVVQGKIKLDAKLLPQTIDDYLRKDTYVLFSCTQDGLKRKMVAFVTRDENYTGKSFYIYLLQKEAIETFGEMLIVSERPIDVDIRVLYHAEADFKTFQSARWVAAKDHILNFPDLMLRPKLAVFVSDRSNPSEDFAAKLKKSVRPLNAKQISAIAIGANNVKLPYEVTKMALINGLPGTGKSMMIVCLVKYLVEKHGNKQHFRLLLSAPNTAAVDILLERLIEAGVPKLLTGLNSVVRLGSQKSEHSPATTLQLERLLAESIEEGLLVEDKELKQARRFFICNYAKVIVATPQAIAADRDLKKLFCETDINHLPPTLTFSCIILDEFSRLTEYETLQLMELPCTKFYFVGDWRKVPPTISFHSQRFLYC